MDTESDIVCSNSYVQNIVVILFFPFMPLLMWLKMNDYSLIRDVEKFLDMPNT